MKTCKSDLLLSSSPCKVEKSRQAPTRTDGDRVSKPGSRGAEPLNQMRITEEHRRSPAAGVLLVNLGTPEAATTSSIRRFLAEFLSDRRVVELPSLFWWPVLHGFILPFRPRRLATAYGHIWTPEGSPLLRISVIQASALQTRLQDRLHREIPVVLAMSYGKPSIAAGLIALEEQGARRIFVLPLFPQYSGSTTGAVMDAVFGNLRGQRWVPELRTVNSYHDHPSYVRALAASVRKHWAEQGRGEHLLLSFHGIPRKYVLAGDPYYCQCQKTARLLIEALQLEPSQYSVAFQSRFGKMPWVQPYTDARIHQLAASGVETLDVICPGFAADCLETLEEVGLRYKAGFLRAGGKRFTYIPALNDDASHLEALTDIAAANLERWLPETESAESIQQRETRAATRYAEMDGRADCL